MGMYNELNKISQSIVTSKQAKQQIKEQQEFEKDLQKELLQIMQERLIIEAENNNIFENETKERILIETIEEYLQSVRSEAWRNRFNNKYRKNLEHFLNQNYFTVAGKAERIEKKQNANKDDYKKKIALEKWELQKQLMNQKLQDKNNKEAEKQRQEALKRQQLKQQQRQEAINTAIEIIGKILVFTIKATIYMIIIPLKIAALFFGGFLGGMIKLK